MSTSESSIYLRTEYVNFIYAWNILSKCRNFNLIWIWLLNIKSLSVALFADIFLPVCRLSFYFVSFAFIVVVQSTSHVRLCNPMDYSMPGFPFLTFFWNLPFAVQKLLSLIKSSLFIFVFISFAFGDRCKKILLWFMSENVLPIFYVPF